jgi:stearoyl-CoA desaturase (delta-9 desaturase)
MQTGINRPAFHVIVTLPLVLLSLWACSMLTFGASFHYLGYVVLGYYVSQMVVCVGLHRLWAHQSYKAHPLVEHILAWFAAGTLQGPILAWASDHHAHHAHTDTENDPHTPLKYKNPLMGLWWSHVGWMLYQPTPKPLNRVTIVKLGRNPIIMSQMKHYWVQAIFMNVVPPALLGLLVEQSLHGLWIGILYVGLGRALQQQATFMVNSVCHFVGSNTYGPGTARDVWWLVPVLLGENWHNFHHAFPRDYRNGYRWYHIDINKWAIDAMYWLGLAWDLEITPDTRVNAKITLTQNDLSARVRHTATSLSQRITDMYAQYIAQREIFQAASQKWKRRTRRTHARMLAQLRSLHQQYSQLDAAHVTKLYMKRRKKIEAQIARIEKYFSRMLDQAKLLTQTKQTA